MCRYHSRSDIHTEHTHTHTHQSVSFISVNEIALATRIYMISVIALTQSFVLGLFNWPCATELVRLFVVVFAMSPFAMVVVCFPRVCVCRSCSYMYFPLCVCLLLLLWCASNKQNGTQQICAIRDWSRPSQANTVFIMMCFVYGVR